MRKQSKVSSVAAGPIRRKAVPALVKGGAFGSKPTSGKEVLRYGAGGVTYDRKGISFRKLNNADPGPKI